MAARLQEGALLPDDLPRLLRCVAIADMEALGDRSLLPAILVEVQRFVLQHMEAMEQDTLVAVVRGLQAHHVDCTPLLQAAQQGTQGSARSFVPYLPPALADDAAKLGRG